MKDIPLVILHGWNISAARFEPLKKELQSRGYQVICFDLPGFRHTTPLNRAYSLSDYCEYVMKELKKREVKKPVIIGHSFGGRIGILLSVSHPDFMRGLVLSGTPALGADLTLKERCYLIVAKIGKALFSRYPLSLMADFMRKILYRIVGSYDYYHTSGYLRQTFQQIVSFRLEPLLHRVHVPVAIIWGEKDRIVPVRVAYELPDHLSSTMVTIVPDAGHSVPWTHVKEFSDSLELFLKTI